MTWRELLAGTKALECHARANAFGDAVGTKHLALDRTGGNKIARTKANIARAQFWLKDMGTANENVASYFTDMQPGQNLLAYVGLVDPPAPSTGQTANQ
jgi:hypothetical protein